MKLTNLLFLLFPCGLFAQNWMPLVPGETYHYRLADSLHITHSIRVDSSKMVGGDVIFYLNRIIQWPEVNGDTIALYKQGQFMGKTMTQKADGRLIFDTENLLFDTSIVVLPNAPTGASWLAVADGNITATVSSIQEGSVLGMLDSLKTIQFSNGASWVLSKNHGLVSAPDFNQMNLIATLSGLENQGIGDRLYRFEDFFNFAVGDMLEYASYAEGLSGSTDILTKITILEKQIATSDTFQYLIDRKQRIDQTGLFNGTTYNQKVEKLVYLKSENKHLNAFNHEVFSLAGTPYLGDGFSFATHVDGGIELGKRYQFNDPAPDCSILEIPVDPDLWITYIDDALDCHNYGYHYFESFRPQLSRTAIHVSVIDYNLAEWLIGASIQGDTLWGHITPDWYFTGTGEPEKPIQLRLSPNPSDGNVSIYLPESMENGLVQVFNSLGQLVHSIDFQHTETLSMDASMLPDGLYFVMVRSGERIGQSSMVLYRK